MVASRLLIEPPIGSGADRLVWKGDGPHTHRLEHAIGGEGPTRGGVPRNMSGNWYPACFTRLYGRYNDTIAWRGEERVVSAIMLRRLIAAGGPTRGGRERLRALCCAVRARSSSHRLLAWCVNACCDVAALLANGEARARIAQSILGVIILGSVFVVPVVCVLTIVGVLLPVHTLLRERSGHLFAFGLLWFIVAIFGAHLRSQQREGA